MGLIEPPHRIGYIDIARGFGILLVVLGHSDLALVSPYLHQLVYAFHVPLFFFLSGFFLELATTFGAFLKKRFRAILQPYFVTILLIYLASLSFTNMRFATALGRIAKSFYATGYYLDWVQLWFLPGLFVTSLFAYFFYRIGLSHVTNRFARWVILLVMLAVGSYFLDLFYPFSLTLLGKPYELYGLPFSLDLVLVSSFFYILGNEIRLASSEKMFAHPGVLVGTGATLILLTLLFNVRVDLDKRLFESFPVNTAEAILGILFTLALSKQMDLRTPRLAAALKYIGQASLFILIFHVPIQEFWAAKIFFVTGAQSFSILSAFVISILICLGIYKIFFEQNPIALFWFGRGSSPPVRQEFTPELTRDTEGEEGTKTYGKP